MPLTYAEIHYRPRFVPSLLFHHWPEILCDAPSRVGPGRPVPLMLYIRHADRYPVTLDSVVVQVTYPDGTTKIGRFPYGGMKVNEPVWWDSINIMPETTGALSILAHIIVARKDGRPVQVTMDNYGHTSRAPLVVEAASSPLPCGHGWYQGDIHCHSFHTADQVEFGPPLESLVLAAHCFGLDWFACTDHSYDLDDRVDSWTENDPARIKWFMMRETARMLSDTVTVIPGEEVTCRGASGANCHMLALDARRFIDGSGDGGERGLDHRTEHSVGEAVSTCVEWGGVACAAHPFEPVPISQRLFLGRGTWNVRDLARPGLGVMQFHNGVRDRGFSRGMKEWVRLLLAGHRVAAAGGSDSHGDMNRRRHVTAPLFSLGEDGRHTFGSVRTVVRAPSREKGEILDGIRDGHSQVTEGPFIDLVVRQAGRVLGPGDEAVAADADVVVRCVSSPEMGAVRTARLLAGVRGDKERVAAVPDNGTHGLELVMEKGLDLRGCLYLRAECRTRKDRMCFTNPVWIARPS